jgi:translation initiation factor eIF-2B subunit beta
MGLELISTELAIGNIIRRIAKVIREEHRIAASRHPSAPTSAPETPYFGPTTPGLNAPASHYLSYDFSAVSAPALNRQASLSNFVAMRHSRAQLERQGSVADASLSAATNSLFASAVDRKGSSDSLSFTPPAMTPRDEMDDATRSKNLRPFIAQVIEEVLGELETTHDDVAKDAKEHIHSSYVYFLRLAVSHVLMN